MNHTQNYLCSSSRVFPMHSIASAKYQENKENGPLGPPLCVAIFSRGAPQYCSLKQSTSIAYEASQTTPPPFEGRGDNSNN